MGKHALERLMEGNRRYVAERLMLGSEAHERKRHELKEGQTPFAAILGCADSRVPVEIIFDQGLGDLFVLRVAGNVAAPSLVGSIELAVEEFGTRLVMVLGHSSCGAVTATLRKLQDPAIRFTPNQHAFVDRIRPVADRLLRELPGATEEELVARTVHGNVEVALRTIRELSPRLAELEDAGELLLVGAEYDLLSGEVKLLQEPA